jgi:small-conductance mechanosensitive channel
MLTEEKEDEILRDLEKLRCKCNNATTRQEEDEIQNEYVVGLCNDVAEIKREITKFVSVLEGAQPAMDDYIEGLSGATRLQKERIIQQDDNYQTLRMLIADSHAQILSLEVLEEKLKTDWKQMKRSSVLQRSVFLERRWDEVHYLHDIYAKQMDEMVDKLADSDDE